MVDKKDDTNAIGLTRSDYRGERSTLCPGCGHNTISAQILRACYELSIPPERIAKFSGIGCSSKSPTYFLSQSFGFNGLHGRMPSLALGAAFADTGMKVIGVSGDGDTASIGLGQFKHLVRRNLPMVYIIENNGVYGLMISKTEVPLWLSAALTSARTCFGTPAKDRATKLAFPINASLAISMGKNGFSP